LAEETWHTMRICSLLVGQKASIALAVSSILLIASPVVGQQTFREWESLEQQSSHRFSSASDEQVRRIVAEALQEREVLLPTHVGGSEVQPAGYPEDDYQTEDGYHASKWHTVTWGSGGRLKIYGYGRGDLIYSTGRLSNTIVPFFALSEGPAGAARTNDGQFTRTSV